MTPRRKGLRPKRLASIDDVPAQAWDALHDPDCNPFLRHAWLSALEHGGPAGPGTSWIPQHLTLWRGTNLVAAAPAWVRDDSRGEFLYDFAWANAALRAGIAYYPKLVVGVPVTPATGTRLLIAPGEDRDELGRRLAEEALGLCREEGLSGVHVLYPTERDAALLEGLGFARRSGVQFHWRNEGYARFDDFLARFASKQRRNARVERATVEKAGITVRTLRGPEAAATDPELVYRLYEAGVEKHAFGNLHLGRAFFARVLATMSEHVELVHAVRDGRVIAGAFNVATTERLWGRYWGALEPHACLHFEVCFYHSIEQCIARGVRAFEGGAGGEHKLSRGFEPVLVRGAHHLTDPRLFTAVRSFVEQERALLASEVEGFRSSTGLRPVAGPDPAD